MNRDISNYIVNGYHANTPVSEKANNAELIYRFALILDSYHPNYDFMNFQDALFLVCLNKIVQKIDYDTIKIFLDDKSFRSIEEFENFLHSISKENRQPPDTIQFEKDEELVCIAETELWVLCGGEFPYSDSYTVSFYTKEDMSEQMINACQVAFETEGTKIQDIIQASLVPINITFWKSIRNTIRSFF